MQNTIALLAYLKLEKKVFEDLISFQCFNIYYSIFNTHFKIKLYVPTARYNERFFPHGDIQAVINAQMHSNTVIITADVPLYYFTAS